MGFVIGLALLGIDQYLKILYKDFQGRESYFLITLQRVDNPGATLGILKNHKKPLLILTVLSIGYLGYLWLVNWGLSICFNLGMGLVIGGAVSNALDRFRLGYVIDYFSFNFRKSPVFNLGDMGILLGGLGLIIIYLFDGGIYL